MKSKEELDALKEEVETENEKLRELSDDDLSQAAGGVDREIFDESDKRFRIRSL